MSNKKLKIWFVLSLSSVLLLLFMKNKPMNILSTFLMKNDAYFHQVADKHSERILSIIYQRVVAYPEYQKYADYSESVDSLFEVSLNEVEKTDLEVQRNYIIENLLYSMTNHGKEELSRMTQYIDYFSADELTQKQLQNWSLNLSKSTMIQKNRIVLLNFYEDRTGGSHHWYDSAEPIIINPSINALIGKKHEFQIGMWKRNKNLKEVKIWINDEVFKTRDGKAFYKKEATKSGWNDLKIKYQGDYQNQTLIDSLTYRYFVCD